VSVPSSANQGAPVTEKQGTNVYTVMLILAFIAIVTACVILSMELQRFGFPERVPWKTS
jgi:hypothetical protein